MNCLETRISYLICNFLSCNNLRNIIFRTKKEDFASLISSVGLNERRQILLVLIQNDRSNILSLPEFCRVMLFLLPSSNKENRLEGEPYLNLASLILSYLVPRLKTSTLYLITQRADILSALLCDLPAAEATMMFLSLMKMVTIVDINDLFTLEPTQKTWIKYLGDYNKKIDPEQINANKWYLLLEKTTFEQTFEQIKQYAQSTPALRLMLFGLTKAIYWETKTERPSKSIFNSQAELQLDRLKTIKQIANMLLREELIQESLSDHPEIIQLIKAHNQSLQDHSPQYSPPCISFL